MDCANTDSLTALIITLLVIIPLLIFSVRKANIARAKKMADTFANRDALSIEAFYHHYFKTTDIPYFVVAGVIKILEEQLDTKLAYLSAEDDFSKNISFFWDYDSMANVEIICALEEEFNIKILDAEAENTKTVRDIIDLVATKTTGLKP